MPTYVMLGHGSELPVEIEHRPVLPEGITLVTAVECGLLSPRYLPGQILQLLKKNEQLANNPVKNQLALSMALGIKIHVYKPGERYPALSYQPVSTLNTDEYFLSGVVDLATIKPRNIELMQTGKEVQGLFEREVSESYSKSVYPNVRSAKTILSRERMPVVPIEDVFREVGQGVYYFPICRDVVVNETTLPITSPELIRAQSYEEQLQQVGPQLEKSEREQLRGFPLRRRSMRPSAPPRIVDPGRLGGKKRMKKRLTKRRKYGARRTTLRLV